MTVILLNEIIQIFRCTMTVRFKFKSFNYFSYCYFRWRCLICNYLLRFTKLFNETFAKYICWMIISLLTQPNKYLMYIPLHQWHNINSSIFLLFWCTSHQYAICNKLFYAFSSKFDIKLGHILEPNGRPLNDERLHYVPLIFQIYHQCIS